MTHAGEPTPVAVIGAGAIGGAVAAVLDTESPHPLTLCVRTPVAHLELHRPDGSILRSSPVVRTDPAGCPPCPMVLLATKAYQSAAAKPWLDRLAGPGTVVAVLQNGIDQVERIQPLAPQATVLPVVVMLAAERRAPGFIRQSSAGLLEVPNGAAGRRFAELFSTTSLRVEVTEDFATRAWSKLLINAVVGAVGALSIRDLGVLHEPDVRAAALGLAREVVTVGRAEGVDFPADAAERSIDRALRGAPGHWSSIAVDRREGRPLEWEVRNAVIGRIGRRHGLATPLNDLVTALLRASDARPINP